MKTTKEMLNILKNFYINNDYYVSICSNMSLMLEMGYFTEGEYDFLESYLKSQKPTHALHTQFYNEHGNDKYWWVLRDELGKRNDYIRKCFLHYLINLQP